MNLNKFLKEERNIYGNLYSKLVFILDDIEILSEDSSLKSRAYYKNLKVLKQYNDLLNDLEKNYSTKKFLGIFSNNKSFFNNCTNFKNTHMETLNKIIQCSNCQCLKCIKDCNFNPCISCNKTGKVNFCDKSTINLIVFDNFRKYQYNSDTNTDDPIDILCEVEFLNIDKRFRIIKDLKENTTLVLEFIYSIKDGDLYNSIDDVDMFNKIIEIYESHKY